jgi:hypothetical protein
VERVSDQGKVREADNDKNERPASEHRTTRPKSLVRKRQGVSPK